ncbi:MAG: excinuclease ABC subunit UvrC [Bacteroidales bacterium]|nr:excinuclease ABC subunit UvrC [Bacteroidales bacterium]
MSNITDQLALLPHDCGVYRFLDKDKKVIYVGKAKDLKKRVSQYFSKGKNLSVKTKRMVSRIYSLEYVVVETESDALLLENNLIKTLQPRYNILLRDDKTFPWICIKNEPFPRVFQTRKTIKDGSVYFGPYTSAYYCKQLLQLVHTLYPLRTCSLVLTPKAIAAGKYRKCLQAHIGRCLAPCVGEETTEQYDGYIRSVVNILKGDVSSVRALLEEQMKEASRSMDFEQAHKYKEQWEALTRYRTKSVIVNPRLPNLDVFSLVMDQASSMAFGNFMRVAGGAVVQSLNVKYKLNIEEEPQDVLSLFMADMQEQLGGLSDQIVVPFLPEAVPGRYKVSVPRKGDKQTLVALSLRNAGNYKREQLRLMEVRDRAAATEKRKKQILTRLKEDLRMKELPVHIECFDNSNLQGSYPVSACVVFRNGTASKKEYRLFTIKNVEGPDDYATFTEVITRRYTRLMKERNPLPQLVVVDGGKGQLSTVYNALNRLGLAEKITVVGLAEKMEEIYLATDKTPLFLEKNSSSLRLLMQLRNEAHRFSLTFHRKKRSQSMRRSVLLDIPGVGPRTMEKLMKRFGSVKKMAEAPTEELSQVVSEKLANTIAAFLKNRQ